MDDDKPIETFDDLFEPFDLEGKTPADSPAAETRPISTNQAPQTGRDPQGLVACRSCGAANPAFNQHCEACGARLTEVAMPVAAQPAIRQTAGARALMVLAGVVLTVALLALAVNVFKGGDGSAGDTSSSVTTTTIIPNVEQLQPIRVDCSSELDAFPCSALIDNDTSNSWNATEGGIGAELTFFFSPPVQITEMFVVNLEDQGRFLRNARMKGVEIDIDDLTLATVIELDDTNEPQRIQIRSLRTSSLTITVTSAYPGQSFDGKEPFQELAAQEIQFFGRPAPAPETEQE